MTPSVEQSVIAVSQRLFLEQAAIDAVEELYKKLLDQTPRAPAMGEFLFQVLTILENMGASTKGRRAPPGLRDCERNHWEYLAAPAEAIGDRLAFASRLLYQFAVYAGGISAQDAKEFERSTETALKGDT